MLGAIFLKEYNEIIFSTNFLKRKSKIESGASSII